MNIKNYMTPTEACHRWGIKTTTLSWHLKKPDTMKVYIDKGWAKSFLKPGGTRKEWIVSVEMMVDLYGKEPKNDY